MSGPLISLRELARRWDDRLLFGDHVQDLMRVVLDREDELTEERLMVFLPHRLVALREVVALLDLHALQGLDQLHRVFSAAEPGLLDAELQEIHRLEVRLDIAVRQRAGRIDLLRATTAWSKNFLWCGVFSGGGRPRGRRVGAAASPALLPHPPRGRG